MGIRETEYRLSISGNQLVEQAFARLSDRIGGLESAQRSTARSTQSLSEQFDEFRGGIEFVALKLQVVIGAIQRVGQAAAAIAERIDEVNSVTAAYAGNVDLVSQRLDGMVRRMDLMRISNQAAQAGLVLTDQQLGDIAVRAKEFADATGGDTVQAMEELTRALVTGREQGLEKFGITANTTERALSQLHEQVGGAGLEGGLTEAFEQMGNRANDAADAFLDVISNSDAITEALNRLGIEGGSLFPDLVEDARLFATMVGVGVGRAINQINVQFRALAEAGSQLSQGNFGAALRALQIGYQTSQEVANAGGGFYQEVAGRTVQGARERAARTIAAQRAAGGRRRRGGGGERETGNTEEIERENARMMGLDQASRDADEQRRAAEEADQEKFRETVEGQQELLRENREAWEEYYERRKELREEALEAELEALEAWGDAGQRIGGVLTDAFQAATEGSSQFFVAVGKGLAKEMQGEAILEFGKAFAALGKAAGAWWTGAGTAAHLAEAQQHFTAAGIFAAGAAAFGAASGGGGGGRGGSGGGGGGGRGEGRPERFGRMERDGGGGGDTVVNVVMDRVVTAGTHRELADEIERVLARGRSVRR